MRMVGRRASALLAALVLYGAGAAQTAFAEAPPAARTGHRVQAYKLESVQVIGSTRMTSAQLVQALGLVQGTPLDDQFVMSARSRLLGLGLFKSVILVMHKGSRPGYARLVVEAEDDTGVLGDWALGGELGITADEDDTAQTASGSNSAPLNYRMGLVGRNLFGAMHRGSFMVDFDGTGSLRAGQLAYGMPRFAREDTQFDAELAVVDPYYRYLDTLGFGGRGQGLWSTTLASGLGEFQYGAAMYVNRLPRFGIRGFPETVAGPKVAYYSETRLRGFFPGAGHLIGASLVLSPVHTEQSLLELDLARTFSLADWVYLTFDSRALTVGTDGYSLRAESRIDVPLGHAAQGEDQAELFLRLRGGHDSLDQTSLVGSAAILGLRYHSSGFISELAVKVTRSPQELAPSSLGKTIGGDR